MIGRTSYGLLFTDLVLLPASVRSQNIGGRLLDIMEREGTRRGCRSAFPHTVTFQAPGFYERHDWTNSAASPAIHPAMPGFA